MNRFTKILIGLTVAATSWAGGCDNYDGPAERAGEDIDEAARDTEDATRDTVDDAADELEDAADDINNDLN